MPLRFAEKFSQQCAAWPVAFAKRSNITSNDVAGFRNERGLPPRSGDTKRCFHDQTNEVIESAGSATFSVE